MNNLHTQDLNASCEGFKILDGSHKSYVGYSLPEIGPLPSREFCMNLNESLGFENWQEHLSWWRGYTAYNLLDDGSVITDKGDKPVTDEAVIAQIHAMRDQDIAITAARRAFVKETVAERYNSNKEAALAILMSVAYEHKCPEPAKVIDGIDFWPVGRNASHAFYMGLRKENDGSVSLFSGSYEEEFEFSPRETFSGGYYGHH